MDEKEIQQEIQQKYAEIQLINQNFQQIQNNISLLNQQSEVLIKVNEALDSIKDVKERTSLLIPLGGGLFMKSKIDKKNDFFVSVGSDVLVKKDLEESKKIIKKQIDEISEVISQLEMNLHELSLRSQKIQEDLNKCIPELETKKQ
jgi:prefoldin alpha subunit